MLWQIVNRLSRTFPRFDLFSFLEEARTLRWNLKEGAYPIYLEYPVKPAPRFGFGKPAHPELHEIFRLRSNACLDTLQSFAPFAAAMARIPVRPGDDPAAPNWKNGFIGGLEAVGLYCLPAIRGSRLYVEIGSGNSTKFVRRSITDHGLATRIVSIDPNPRAEIDRLCDEVIRQPLEEVDLAVFDAVAPGDVVMFDGSHRCFQNSDVTVFFLEVLPRLRPGVLVYIDDIFLPYDYPPAWAARHYSEQYVLAAAMLANPSRYLVDLGCIHVGQDSDLRRAADRLIASINPQGIGGYEGYGNGLWMHVGSAGSMPASNC